MSEAFDKLSVLDSFIEEVNSYLPEIETNLERLAQSPGDMEALEETHRRTHTIGGSASMMDFPGLAHVAHGMEDILSDVLEGAATIDPPTLGLLQRSLKRLYTLVGGIRDNSVDQDAMIAEDDADYSQYRAQMDAAAQGGSSQQPAATAQEAQYQYQPPVSEEPQYSQYQAPAIEQQYQYQPPAAEQHYQPQPAFEQQYQAQAPLVPEQQYYYQAPAEPQYQYPSAPAEQPAAQPASSLPSFDEMLAAFRTPVAPEGEELAWPEDIEPAQAPEPSAPSALDMLMAETRGGEPQYDPYNVPASNFSAPPTIPPTPPLPVEEEHAPRPEPQASPITRLAAQYSSAQGNDRFEAAPVTPVPRSGSGSSAAPVMSPRVYTEMQEEVRSLETQAASLQETLAQLRQAVTIIEAQRGEFRSFLDGSKDALDRLEDWAGQAMGLNLRNSPEQVRRYLPLSVMWAANRKLKEILELLGRVTGGVEVTDEQIRTTLQQLQGSVETCGEMLRSLPGFLANQEPGWTPWEVQLSRDSSGPRERVTFERRGDIEALRAELEQQIREEVRQEYESRPLTLAARMELEQQIREQVRQEFERKRQLQEEIVGSQNLGQETYRELEMRLRNEIEIEVRREFLAQITGEAADLKAPLSDAALQNASFASDRAQGPSPMVIPRVSATPQPVVPPAPAPSRSIPASAEAGDFGEEAAEIFRLEAEEHLQTISMNVAALEKSPHDRDILQGIRRATHTLKGAAGMMGFRLIADLCHVSEDLLDSIMEGSISISPPVLSVILDTAETLDRLINRREEYPGALEAEVQAMRARYAELLGEQHLSPLPGEEEIDSYLEAQETPALASLISESQQPAPSALQQTAAKGDLSVRVRLQKLDELVNLFGELLVNRSVLEERIQRLVRLVADVSVSSERLRDVGQKLESRFEAATLPSGHTVTAMPGTGNGSQRLAALGGSGGDAFYTAEPAHLAEFDELELDRYTEFHQLTRGLSEGVSDMSTLSSEMEAVIRECESVFARENRLSATFQDRLMKTRLVPLSSMIPRLYRTVRSVALKQHKEIDFATEGDDTEVDRTVYEEIAGPLLHLLRNAVNHGIEEPDVRLQRGKPAAGLIKLSAAYEGNQVVITVRDDGAGIDPERVRQSAIARGLIRPDQMLSPGEVIDLIFRPGFSTAEVLSEESGRGVGLDVVRDSISRLRATLEVDSTPGQGTAFTMKFPTSLAIQSIMMVRIGDQQFALSTALVEAIGRLDTFKRTTSGGRPAVQVQNDTYPLYQLARFLKMRGSEIEDKSPLLLINTGRHRVALVVDEVRGRMDVVMKNLGPHLRHVHGVAGGTVLGNGRVILILEMNELLSTQLTRVQGSNIAGTVAYRDNIRAQAPEVQLGSTGITGTIPAVSSRAMQPSSGQPMPERGKHILVVDDSPSVRRVVSNMLKQHGWEVQTARDGVEALESITNKPPAAVLLDIEMPRMDGYELMATVRAQEQFRTLPLVVLTSRAASKHQQRATQLGASAYIIKPYQDEELINILNSLVYGATV